MKTFLRIICSIALLNICASLTSFAADEKTDKPKPYPLKTCITDDEKLGSMGDPEVFTYKGREIKLCCSGCRADFDKNPGKYVKKLEKAEKKQQAKK